MIDITEYTYPLPPEKIAAYPLEQRDQSKLLYYFKGTLRDKTFTELPDLLPENTLLIFNDTRVIPARIIFQKETGAEIEIFLLSPHSIPLLQDAMQATRSVTWKCTIGNLKRWPKDTSLTKVSHGIELTATLANREEGLVTLSWQPEYLTFAEVVQNFGDTPLPPYIKRASEASDKTRYQTIYSSQDGAVAAPTAGLHFSDEVLTRIKARGIASDFLTLHVSAGTFQPVKVADATDHTMHAEQVVISKQTLQNLLQDRKIIAVGTTSLRTLESLYWYGVKLIKKHDNVFNINQFYPYDQTNIPTKDEALKAILTEMEVSGAEFLTGTTSIFILPGYSFKIVDGLITNFHQPGSTLMLLVAAFIGENWKKVYNHALTHSYRFLSFGDSSLLMP